MARAQEHAPVFLYRFSALRRNLHGIDGTFWRGTEPIPLADHMARYLANFVATGNPNGQDLPVWDSVSSDTDAKYLDLGSKVVMEEFDSGFRERTAFLAR